VYSSDIYTPLRIGEVPRQHTPRRVVYLDLPQAAVARPVETQVKTSHAREEGTYSQHHASTSHARSLLVRHSIGQP
jgi:hypothetical protein